MSQNPLLLQQDLRLLQKFKKPVVLFDAYNTAIDLIEQFADLPAEAKLIVAVRTGVQDVRLHEIQSRLPTPLRRIDLNGIHKEDIDDFQSLLDQSGVRAPDLEQVVGRSKDFREVVVACMIIRKSSVE